MLTHVKFSGATWLPDHRSFLYVHFPTAGEASGTGADALPAGRLMRHVVGTAQSDDTLVWEEPDRPRVIPEPRLTHDGRWLVLHLSEGTSEKNRLWPTRCAPARTAAGSARRSGSSTSHGR